MADNAIYTHPGTLEVTVYEDEDSRTQVQVAGNDHLHLGCRNTRHEAARVTGRGNLARSGTQRWYEVTLASGERHMVLAPGT